MDDYTFSVLMSVYYKEKPSYLEQSISSLLNSTLLPNEIVIVKDGNLPNELEAVLEKYKNNPIFKIIGYEKNMGLGYALRFGVLNCSNEIIARMDSDDICSSTRFEKQIAFLYNNPKIRLIGSNTLEFIDNVDNAISKRVMPEFHDNIVSYSKTRNPFVHPSVVFYKSDVLEVGNFQEKYLCEDYDMWVKLIKKGCECYNIQENLVFMRISKDFYKRRGGLKYCKAICKFKKELYISGYMNNKEYMKSKMATIVVSLSPSVIREYIYKKKLRV